jgi:hypothetical protein
MTQVKPSAKPLLITGLIAGTLDGLAAAISYYIQTGKDPLNVYRFVASGVLGTDAFSGGASIAVVGILFHYIIAFSWTILFFTVASRLNFLLKNWIVSGILYGIFVWIAMNFVVVPLSLVPMKSGPQEWSDILKGAVILVLCIGLPISYFARKYLSARH